MRWGHQWKRVVEWMRSGRAWSATQRAAWASSSSSIVAKCWLARAVLVSGQQSQEMLGGLQLGGVGRQEEQVDVLRHAQLDAGMPTSAVQHEHDLLARAGADLAGKRVQFGLEQRDAHRGGEVEDSAPLSPEAGCTKPTR